MQYAVDDVFSPRSFPQNTYITRKINNNETVDEKLRRALTMKGNLIFISGASKSGKTVLCRSVIDSDRIIDLSGTQLLSKDDFWNHIAEQISLPDLVTTTTGVERSHEQELGGGVKAVAAVAGINISGTRTAGRVSASHISVAQARTERQIIKYLIDNNKVLVIDDFHYAAKDVQMYVARTLKTELFNGLKAAYFPAP